MAHLGEPSSVATRHAPRPPLPLPHRVSRESRAPPRLQRPADVLRRVPVLDGRRRRGRPGRSPQTAGCGAASC